MEDKDYLTTILNIEKNMSTNLNIALNEMSNQPLYLKVKEMHETIRNIQRETYYLLYNLGFYKIELAKDEDIKKTLSNLTAN